MEREEMAEDEKEVTSTDVTGGGKLVLETCGDNALYKHIKEEKLSELVMKGREEGAEAVKINGKVSRYVKFLNCLIKIKNHTRLGHRKKPMLRLAV